MLLGLLGLPRHHHRHPQDQQGCLDTGQSQPNDPSANTIHTERDINIQIYTLDHDHVCQHHTHITFHCHHTAYVTQL